MRECQTKKCLSSLLHSEIFFVPYIWDVIVGSLTASTFEWARNMIEVFPLNHNDSVINEIDDDEMMSASNGDYYNNDHRHTQEVV